MNHLDPHFSTVREMVAHFVKLADDEVLTPQTLLHEVGLDSLATVNLMVALAEAAEVDLEDYLDDFAPPRTIADLCAIAVRFDSAGKTG
jgi:acyl carrier protein